MRSREPLTIPIRLDRREPRRALHEQITDQVAVAVDQGRLPCGMRVPSTRTLATVLGVSRGVAAAAYMELLVRGYLETRRGSGTYVAAGVRAPVCQAGRPRPPAVDLTPGHVAEELFPAAAWSAAWRQAAATPPPARVPPAGASELRNALIRQALWPMGVSLDHHTTIVTGGAAHSLRLVLTALGAAAPGGRPWSAFGARGPHGPGPVAERASDGPPGPGEREVFGRRSGAAVVALEEPAAGELHRAAGTAVPLPVDEAGVDPGGVPDGCDVLVVAPEGQPPLGRVMPLERRRAVVAWARRTGGHVVVLAPAAAAPSDLPSLPSLLAAAGIDRTILVGELSDGLAPALRLGYAVVPAALTAAVTALLRDSDAQPPHVAQLAAARLLRDGTLHAHTRRLVRLHAHKRRYVESTLAPLGAAVRLGPPETAGTTPLYLPPGTDAAAVVAALAARRVRVRTLAPYHWATRPAPPALTVSYGHPTAAALRHGLAAIVAVLETL